MLHPPSHCGQVRTLLAVVRSVHGKVDRLTFAKELPCYVCLITLRSKARLYFEAATLGLVNILFYLFFIEMRLNFTTHLQMVLGPVFVDDQVLAS